MERRTFIMSTFAGTASLALGVSFYTSQYSSARLYQTDTQYRLLFSVLLPVFLDGALPQTAQLRTKAVNRTLDAIEQTLTVLPEETREEITTLLDLLDSRLGILLVSGSVTPLILRDEKALITLLEHWRHSYLDMMNIAYKGLKEIVLSSYYSLPEHWSHLNYAKPNLPRG